MRHKSSARFGESKINGIATQQVEIRMLRSLIKPIWYFLGRKPYRFCTSKIKKVG